MGELRLPEQSLKSLSFASPLSVDIEYKFVHVSMPHWLAPGCRSALVAGMAVVMSR